MRFVGIIVLLLLTNQVVAQYYSTGSDPGYIKWNQINTNNFQIIFPEDYEKNAMKVADILSHFYISGSRSLDHYPKKISVVLHTHTAFSNGLVSWAPRRVELYGTPNQTMSPMDWLDQLIVHEYRHVVQMDKIDSELPKLIKFLFGEQASALVAGLYLPFWFLEGDAVVTESVMTNSGRGRLPSFLMLMKAQALEKGIYSYDKATLGSYKDFVPDRYNFGFWFLTESRRQYGDKLWADVVHNIARKPFSITPMNKVLKERTGMRKNMLYHNTFNNLVNNWKSEINSISLSSHKNITPISRGYINYIYTQAQTDSSFIAIKKRRGDIDRVVEVKNFKEKVLFTPGQIIEESFSVTGNYSIRAEMVPHVRWTHGNYSRIIVQNLTNNKKSKYYYYTNLSSPAISPNLMYYTAVETDFNNKYYLSVFDLNTGKYLKRFVTKDNHYFTTPSWNSSSDTIFFVGINRDGNYLGMIDINSGKIQELTQPSYHNIKNPEYYNGNVYYVSGQTGINNIFGLNLNNNNVRQITSVKYGADHPSIVNDQLYFSNYMADGFKVAKMNITDSFNIIQDTVRYYNVEVVSLQEDSIFIFKNLPEHKYDIKPYSKFKHLFNTHSWGPIYVDADNYEVHPGVSFLSQNKLGTAISQFGYLYDPSNETGKFIGKFNYSGLFPVFSANVEYGNRKTNIRVINQQDTLIQKIKWHELSADFDISVPFLFNPGKYNLSVVPEIKYNYVKILHSSNTPQNYAYRGYYHSLSYKLLLYNRIRMAGLDIVPDWGQSLELIYRHSPSTSGGSAMSVNSLAAVNSFLYFPGFKPNHGLRIYNGYQTKEKNSLLTFSDEVRLPRGIGSINNFELYTMGTDYITPLSYPDISIIPGLYYLKRLRSSLFYDFSMVRSSIYNMKGEIMGAITNNFSSCGVELIADGHFLRLAFPVTTGLRSIYIPDNKEFRFEFLLSINFNAF